MLRTTGLDSSDGKYGAVSKRFSPNCSEETTISNTDTFQNSANTSKPFILTLRVTTERVEGDGDLALF